MHSIRGRDRARARDRDRDMDRLGLGLGLGLGSGLYTSTLFSFPGMRFRKCVFAFQFPGSPLYVPSTQKFDETRARRTGNEATARL